MTHAMRSLDDHRIGHTSGYEEGYKRGYEEGYNEGYKKGHTIGFKEGKTETILDFLKQGCITKEFASLEIGVPLKELEKML